MSILIPMKLLRNFAIYALMGATPFAAASEEFQVLMLNAATDDAQHTNLFTPDLLHVQVGDTVTFTPTDNGHNTASKRGMLPEGAEPWNSPTDEDFSITFLLEGVYGYICVPHYEMGMVGLIIVGDEMAKLEDAKDVRQVGRARAAFRDLFDRLEAG
jgi:pseudoazurin